MKLMKRLWPLYIGLFFQGLVFWYVIEKLFMTKLGFNPTNIGLSVAILSAIALIAEIPSGILADRWSRKGTLALSSALLVVCALIGAISNSVPIYLICSAFWGLYVAMSSGTTESMIFDVLLEENKNSDNYEHEFGKTEIFSSIALVIGAICGGAISQYFGLRYAYWLSIPSAIISIIFILMFNEPKLHKQNQDKSLIRHIRLTFSSVFKKSDLALLIISLLSSTIVFTIVVEMGQIWMVTLSAPIFIYSMMMSLNSSVFGLGGILSRFIKSKKKMLAGMLVTLICILCLIFSHNVWVVLFAIFSILLIVWGSRIVITHIILDRLPSQVRAGSLSSISSVSRLFIIPTSMFFGFLATKYTVFLAGWFLVALFIVSIICLALNKLKLNYK